MPAKLPRLACCGGGQSFFFPSPSQPTPFNILSLSRGRLSQINAIVSIITGASSRGVAAGSPFLGFSSCTAQALACGGASTRALATEIEIGGPSSNSSVLHHLVQIHSRYRKTALFGGLPRLSSHAFLHIDCCQKTHRETSPVQFRPKFGQNATRRVDDGTIRRTG